MANTSMIKIYNESYWHVDGVRYKNKFKALESAGNDIMGGGFNLGSFEPR